MTSNPILLFKCKAMKKKSFSLSSSQCWSPKTLQVTKPYESSNNLIFSYYEEEDDDDDVVDDDDSIPSQQSPQDEDTTSITSKKPKQKISTKDYRVTSTIEYIDDKSTPTPYLLTMNFTSIVPFLQFDYNLFSARQRSWTLAMKDTVELEMLTSLINKEVIAINKRTIRYEEKEIVLHPEDEVEEEEEEDEVGKIREIILASTESSMTTNAQGIRGANLVTATDNIFEVITVSLLVNLLFTILISTGEGSSSSNIWLSFLALIILQFYIYKLYFTNTKISSLKWKHGDEERLKVAGEGLATTTTSQGSSSIITDKPICGSSFSVSWRNGEPKEFTLRSSSYLETGIKLPCSSKLYECIGVDFISCAGHINNIQQLLKFPVSSRNDSPVISASSIPDFFVVNLQFSEVRSQPFATNVSSKGYTIAISFKLTERAKRIVEYIHSSSNMHTCTSHQFPSEEINGVKLFESYCALADHDESMKTRFKLITQGEESSIPSVFQRWNGKPLLIKKSGLFFTNENGTVTNIEGRDMRSNTVADTELHSDVASAANIRLPQNIQSDNSYRSAEFVINFHSFPVIAKSRYF